LTSVERGYSSPQRLRPRRVLRRIGGELPPDFLCADGVPFLGGGKTEKKARLGGRGIFRRRRWVSF